MADMNNPTALSLGRVSTNAPVIRSTAAMLQPDTAVTDGLLSIGKQIAGGLVKNQLRKEFYAGQDQILQASLEGTQKETLQRIIEEQPYYMQLMGNGATADGAVEMASRVGAGKIFDSNVARLASGMDAEVDPDTYRKQVMEQIASQRTGNEEVDAVFMPQMITKGQSLIGTHLSKHLEFNARNAQLNSIDESNSALETLTGVIKAESGDPTAKFLEGTPDALMTPTTKVAYANVVNTFNPDTRPLNVDEKGWLTSKLALAIPSMESGNTAVYQALRESGMYGRLTAEDRVKADDARLKGKRVNDSNSALQFLGEEASLTTMVFKAKTYEDVQKVNQKAQEIARKYDLAGITRPDKFKDDAAIKEYSFSALREKNQFDEKMDNRRYTELVARRKEAADLAKIQMEKSLIAGQAQAFNSGIRTNALGNHPHAPVRMYDAETGQMVLREPTPTERMAAYNLDKSNLLQLSPEQRTAALAERGIRSMEELAYKFDVVDTAVQGNVTQTLRAVVGHPTMGAAAKDAIEGLRRLKAVGDPTYAMQYLKDTTVAQNYALFDANFSATNNAELAWSRSFGRIPSTPATLDLDKFNTALKSSDVKDVIEKAGRFGPQAEAFIKAEATHALRTAVATDYEDAFTLGVQSYMANSEVVGDQQMLGVPPAQRIAARTGIRNPETLNAAIRKVIVDTKLPDRLPKGITGYQIDYNPVAKQHIVVPHNEDDKPLFNSAFPLNYQAVKDTLYKPPVTQTGTTLLEREALGRGVTIRR